MNNLAKSFLILAILATPAILSSTIENSADIFLHKLFGNKKAGVFFDMGATDGITNNKTYYFEKKLGWMGACLESLPSAYEKLRTCRLAVCINAAIAPQSGTQPFLKVTNGNIEYTALSGPLALFEPAELKRIIEAAYNLKGKVEFADMPCFTFAQIMEALELDHIDLLSIAKGEQWAEILKTIDFNAFTIDVIVIENTLNNYDIQKILITNGFALLKKTEFEEIYRNTNYLR